jgi:hypothetical protein
MSKAFYTSTKIVRDVWADRLFLGGEWLHNLSVSNMTVPQPVFAGVHTRREGECLESVTLSVPYKLFTISWDGNSALKPPFRVNGWLKMHH